MKSIFSTISFLLSFTCISCAQTTEQIVSLHIYAIDDISTWQNKPRTYTRYYDEKGNIVKEIQIMERTKTSTITSYKYSGSLLSEVFEVNFENGKRVDSLRTNYQYEFDSANRMMSKTTTTSSGNISTEKISYNKFSQPDSVLVYNNDTTIWNSKNTILGEKHLNKIASIKKLRVYSYMSDGTVSMQECTYPYPETYSCKTTETFKNDTLEVLKERYWGRQGCVMDSAQKEDYIIQHKQNG